jgi:RimJ/RimL family protein N-acetyltransferase
LHPDHWGRGYATEAGAEAIRYAFEDLDVDRIFSCILTDNDASQAVAVRLGMELLEERTMDFFPAAPHGIWSRAR